MNEYFCTICLVGINLATILNSLPLWSHVASLIFVRLEYFVQIKIWLFCISLSFPAAAPLSVCWFDGQQVSSPPVSQK